MRVAVGGTINPFTVGYTDASQEPAVLLNYSGDPVVIQCEKSTRSEVLACAYWTQQYWTQQHDPIAIGQPSAHTGRTSQPCLSDVSGQTYGKRPCARGLYSSFVPQSPAGFTLTFATLVFEKFSVVRAQI